MTVPVDAIRALIEERERYESWLGSLDARRDATPAHVFDRVRADYDGRLRAVRDRLAAHVTPLRDEEQQLARRQDEVERALTERQDELAEVELRTLVGEYAADDGERRVQQTAAAVRELDGERRALSEQLGALRSLLERASATGGQAAAPAPAPPTEPAGPAADATASSEPATEPASVAPDAPRAEPGNEQSSGPAPVAPHTETSAGTAGWPAKPTPPARAGDEAGFVGTAERLGSLAASLGSSTASPTPAAVASNQEKTLKCQDCGEMNYPTEWYCERCGGELAAL